MNNTHKGEMTMTQTTQYVLQNDRGEFLYIEQESDTYLVAYFIDSIDRAEKFDTLTEAVAFASSANSRYKTPDDKFDVYFMPEAEPITAYAEIIPASVSRSVRLDSPE